MERLFKKGDLLECVKDVPGFITEGERYEVLSDQIGRRIVIKYDFGMKYLVLAKHFKLHKAAEEVNETEEQPDMVNNPPHYMQGGIDCIEAIKAALTEEEFRGHCKANAMKYIWREKHKGGNESIEKAIWYLKQLL